MTKWLSAILEKPWQSEPSVTEHASTCFVDQQLTRNRTALHFLLAVISVVFFLFTVTLLQRSQAFDFQALAGEIWRPLSDKRLLWINTAALLLSSIMLSLASIKAKLHRKTQALVWVGLAAVCGVWFIVGQFTVWQQLSAAGYHLTSNPANSYFYLLTGIHGMHIAGGLIVLFRVFWHIYRPVTPQSLANFLSLCTTYWHFLFVVWLGLFALLTSDSETFATIAAMCGF